MVFGAIGSPTKPAGRYKRHSFIAAVVGQACGKAFHHRERGVIRDAAGSIMERTPQWERIEKTGMRCEGGSGIVAGAIVT